MLVDQFFAYARERQTIYLKKQAGLPDEQWTDDPILWKYRFCCVFREDDRTTRWLAENVRAKINGPELFLATIVFRWFNRIETGEAIFTERDLLGDGRTAWTHFLETNDTDVLRRAILKHRGPGPYVTGAYCIIGLPHMSKLDGVLGCIERVSKDGMGTNIKPGFTRLWWRDLAEYMLENPGQVYLESVWDWFRRFPRSGDFMAYEVVTDFSHCQLLRQAPDIMTWANAGPGAIRGLNRIFERPLEQQMPKESSNFEMASILKDAQSPEFWPQPGDGGRLVTDSEVYVNTLSHPQNQWPAWDMRTVEHTLCEFDKYQRLLKREGKVKGVYR